MKSHEFSSKTRKNIAMKVKYYNPCNIRLLFCFILSTKINGELNELVKNVMIRTQELKDIIANQNQTLQDYTVKVNRLESRLDDLELDVSFSTYMDGDPAETTVNENPVVFTAVKHNNGFGYNTSTGDPLIF